VGVSAVVVKVLRGWLGRLLLATVGLSLVAYLVHGAGPGRVARVLIEAGPWLPAIFALEIVQILSDAVALNSLLPAERIFSRPAAPRGRSRALR
jgi:hypothetical protein